MTTPERCDCERVRIVGIDEWAKCNSFMVSAIAPPPPSQGGCRLASKRDGRSSGAWSRAASKQCAAGRELTVIEAVFQRQVDYFGFMKFQIPLDLLSPATSPAAT